jgi:serine/threonine-protein kinase
VRVASERAQSGIVVVIVDDVDRCDGLTRLVLTGVLDAVEGTPCLLLTASADMVGPSPCPAVTSIVLRGLDDMESERFLERAKERFSDGAQERPGKVSGERPTQPNLRFALPLYLEQVRALSETGFDEPVPPRLADAVIARIEQLDLPSRRMLQACSVLGDSFPIEWLRTVAPASDHLALYVLIRLGFLTLSGDRVEWVHPFIRELVESSIPAETRNHLHDRALEVAVAQGAVLEVRAEHAFKGGDVLTALLLLEQMGDASFQRGDSAVAVLAYRRGLELTRREFLRSGETAYERAVVTFSRKLAEALEANGDRVGAEGVLCEALELAQPGACERARMLLALGRIAMRRERPHDAQRLLGQALEAVRSLGNARCEAEIQLALAALRRGDGDLLAAANTFRRACELLESETGTPGTRALLTLAQVEYAEVLAEIGDAEFAHAYLEMALGNAQDAGAQAIAARASGVRGSLLELAGDRAGAARLYREAWERAAQAGDAEGARRWKAAWASLSGEVERKSLSR